MSWFVRGRLLVYIIVFGCGVEMLGCAVNSVEIPFVSLRSAHVSVNVALALSVVVPVAWAVSLSRSSPIEQTAVRPLRQIVSLSTAVVVATIVGAGLAGDTVFGGDTGLATARNVAAMIGLVLIAFTCFDASLAALVPVCYFIASTLVGQGQSHQVAWWAIPIAPATSRSAFVLAAVMLLAGLGVFASTLRQNVRF